MAQVIPANIQLVEQLSNTVLMSSKSETTNGSQIFIPLQGGLIPLSDQTPLTKGVGQEPYWQFTVPDGTVVNTANSFIRYRVKYVFNCLYATQVANNGDTVQVSSTPGKLVDPLTQAFMPPGHYYVSDDHLWCEPAIIPDKAQLTGITQFGKRVAICLFPMNGLTIINQSKIQYGNITQVDENVFQQRTIPQMLLNEQYQAGNNTEFFEQNTDNLMDFYNMNWIKPVDGKPGSWSIPQPAGTKYTHVVYKDWIVHLNSVNQLLDVRGKFYTLGYTKQLVQLRTRLQSQSIAKAFFTELLCDSSHTGITELELKLYCKTASCLPSMLQQRDAFVQWMNKCQMDPFPIGQGISSNQTYKFSQGHTSTNEVVLALSQDDSANVDSAFLKQRFTLMNATQINNYLNGQMPFRRFVFFHNLNIYRGNQAQRYFSEDIKNPSEMRHEVLRSLNMFQQYETAPSQALNDIMKMMMKYAVIRINLEAFKQESQADGDVVYDGYYSSEQQILVKTAFRLYDLDTNQVIVPGSATLNYQNTDGSLNPTTQIIDTSDVFVEQGSNVLAFQYYDLFAVVNPKTGSMVITEDVK